MFCHKCGSNIANGASFCHKCGAKMTSGDTTVQTPNTSAATIEPSAASISTKPKQPQTHDVPSGTPKKKKWGKLPIILGAVALVIVLISIVANSDKVSDFLQNQGNVTLTTSSGMETVKLSQTYTNEAEGFSFKYPSDWTVMEGTELYNTTHDDSAVVCLYAPEGFGAASNILVNKTQADYSLFDYTKTDFEQLFAPMFDEVSVTDLSNINIDGFSVTKLELAIKEGTETLLVDRYYYIIGNFTYVMSGTTRQSAIDSDGPVVDVIMDSYTITAANMSSGSGTSPDVISYEGISIGYLLGSTDDVISLLGDSSLNDEFKLRYDDIEFYHDNGTITSLVSSDPSLIEADDITLNKNRDGLIEIFGQSYEEGGEKGSYSMTYNLLDCSLHFELGEPTSEAWRITISPITTTDSISGEILYNGEPIMNLLGKTPDELISIFGVPTSGTTVNGDMYEGGEYYGYQGITFIINHQSGTVDYVMGSPNAIEANGISLDKSRSDIISALGTPTSEEVIPGDEYYDARYIMTYDMDEYGTILSVEMPDADSKANRITIARYEDGSGDENYNNTSATTTATDFVGTYSYDASFEDPTGKWNNFYYLLEIGLDGSALVVTQTWRGNYLFDHARVSPSDITGNTLVFDASVVGSTEPEIHSLTYLPAKDSPLGTDTIYIDDDDTMPFVRE